MMIVLGITGGSGCGKTAVCEHLMDLGIDVIDTDKVARMIVSPKMPALFEIEDEFGSAYLNEDGTLNRKKLGELVFSDPDKLLALNKITHKYITQYVLEYIKNCENDMVAIDGAVLLESEIATICDYIISVLADKNIRIERIIKRDNLSLADAKARIEAQRNDKFYIEKSDYIVYNNKNKDLLNNEIEKIISDIRRKS